MKIGFVRNFGILVIILIVVTSLIPIIYTSGSRSFMDIDIPANGYNLKGYISPGVSAEGLWVVFTHGNRKDGQAHLLNQMIRNNISKDVSVLAIDFRGFGGSTFGSTSNGQPVLDRSADIYAAVNYLSENYDIGDNQIILVGHSFGAVQVLNASKNHDYRVVIAIGPSDFSIFINDRKLLNDYIEKFKRNTGVTITAEEMMAEGSQLTPESLFSSCPGPPVAMVFGSSDNPETLLFHQDRIPDQCKSKINWFIIPLSGHMYGTETSLPQPFGSFYSRISLSLLKWRLNNLLAQ